MTKEPPYDELLDELSESLEKLERALGGLNAVINKYKSEEVRGVKEDE